MEYHVPVLLNEVLDLLSVKLGNIYIDGTLGNGGHTLEILKKGGEVYGIDSDQNNLDLATSRIVDSGYAVHFHPIKGNFTDLKQIISKNISSPIHGILLDLGLSSNQQKASGRGFSFNDEQSLDMRLDPATQELTAEKIINTYSFEQLFNIFSKIAQEKLSKPLAQKIITKRKSSPIKDGATLAKIIRDAYLAKGIRTKIDPSTKIFMALRIVVNQEFENLKQFLDSTLHTPSLNNATVCIISFHSGEDRIVKQFIREHHPSLITSHSSKAITATHKETAVNPLSRSAVLRSYRIN
ncbi:16S rRNA (cytosine(1402)-N(4))-methyltransferase RsmH [Candidatus Shapirobacteria bacterium]|nr:16S rRNA (cytosine(1402)-N(4))-methyltransferase RsmH [Candidatus Shapirobacteria bacterium]